MESGRRRRSTNYPLEFKRRLAEQACDESVSVAQLALEHGLNTNMLFRWRRQLRAGMLDIQPALLPVTLAPTCEAPAREHGQSGEIEVIFGDTRLCIRGNPDPATLQLVLQALRR
jgi:transposase